MNPFRILLRFLSRRRLHRDRLMIAHQRRGTSFYDVNKHRDSIARFKAENTR